MTACLDLATDYGSRYRITLEPRRRRLNDAHRAKLVAAGTAALARHRAATNSEDAETAPESTPGSPGRPEAA